ncbi:ARID DNA-binding domain-containing protein [Tanacetum coccineum]
MFEEDKEGCDGETDCATSKEGNGCDVETKSMIAKHNKYLEEYFDSIDSKDACPLIKGLEELKWDRNIVQDYLDEDYKSVNGTLYAIKVNSFKRPWFKEEPVKCEKTKKVEGGCDHAKEENPQEHDGSSKNGLGVVRQNTREYFENVQRSETRFGVILEGNNDTVVDQMTDQEDGANISEIDDFVISYIFEEDKEGCDGETDYATSKEGNGCDVEIESMIVKHNKYLEEYFDSIDSLIKGLEELKWDRNIVIGKYLERGNVKIDLLGLYKMVDSMGGYVSVSFGNRWKEVAVIHGLTEAHEEDLKACYKRTIDMVKFCYDTTLRPWFKEELVKCEKTKKVEGGCDHAKEENPKKHNGSSKNGLGVVRENTREYFENVQRRETRFGVILEGNNDTDDDQMANQEDGPNISETNDFVVIT